MQYYARVECIVDTAKIIRHFGSVASTCDDGGAEFSRSRFTQRSSPPERRLRDDAGTQASTQVPQLLAGRDDAARRAVQVSSRPRPHSRPTSHSNRPLHTEQARSSLSMVRRAMASGSPLANQRCWCSSGGRDDVDFLCVIRVPTSAIVQPTRGQRTARNRHDCHQRTQ